MKKLFLALGLLSTSLSFALMQTYDPRYAQQQGVFPSQLSTGELVGNMANGQACPVQVQPMQAPLNQQMMQLNQQQYIQGVHGTQIFQQ
ncbi:MAG: hypothetical protein R3A80_05705 [Bdellovibrionota bacterium]